MNSFFHKGGKQLQVTLTIPWKHNVQIEYLALSVSGFITRCLYFLLIPISYSLVLDPECKFYSFAGRNS